LKVDCRRNRYALPFWHPALFPGRASTHRETFEKYEILFEFEEGDPALAGLTTGIH
jgi:hypothetical protein